MFFNLSFVGKFRWTSITRFIVYESFKHSTIVIVTVLLIVTTFYSTFVQGVLIRKGGGGIACIYTEPNRDRVGRPDRNQEKNESVEKAAV